ncbi:MAG: Ribosomal RNA small subunit methyltransferase H [Chlamydiia bacterium]|nr:Ribosomal RNA small subunit methyltransferase H [Chlamydiia bacterium]
MQFDDEDRGFSFMNDGPLDMRMDTSVSVSAKDIIAEMSEKELGVIFRDLGEERLWRNAAKAITKARAKKPIKTTNQLKEVVEEVIPRRGKTHPATKVFQAIRMYVNKELESIEKSIKKALSSLAPEGRVSVISFHSLEDRLVKNIFRNAATPMKDLRGMNISPAMIRVITKKPIPCSKGEMKRNRRARSAKLRVAEKLSR